MAEDHSQPRVYNNYDFNPSPKYEPYFQYPPVPEDEHLASIQKPHTLSHNASDGVMYGTNIGDHQVFGNRALGNVLPEGTQDLRTAPSAENVEVPIQSIEQPINHGQFTNLLQAAADVQSCNETVRMDSKQRAGSRNSQALQSTTPEPLLNKLERKKRMSSSAAPPPAKKRRRTEEEHKSQENQSVPSKSPERNTITPKNPNEKFVGGAAGVLEESKENPKLPAPERTSKLGAPKSNNAQGKRKLGVVPPSANKLQNKSDNKTPEQQVQHAVGTEMKDSVAAGVVFVSPEGQIDQAAMAAKAREVGVHSAVALFRPPTEASKKYSRPPMSELYEKLQVTPDQFLHLQAAAKDYMLDPEHPERREVIGKKSAIDLPSSNTARIKLYRITSAFLWEEGWGEKCWGPTAPRSVPRDIDWPEAEPEVIGMMIPLMRRMVTNENQRLYAEEQRKARAPYTSGGGKREPNAEEILEKLKGQIYKPKKSKTPNGISESEKSISPDPAGANAENRAAVASPKPKAPSEWDGMHFYINITKDGRRAMPRVEFAVDNGEGFTHLSQHVDIIIDDDKNHKVKILGPTGLVDITDEISWKGILTQIKDADWMDGDVRICVDLNS